MRLFALALISFALAGCSHSNTRPSSTAAPSAPAPVASAKSAATRPAVRTLSLRDFRQAHQDHPEYVLLDVRTPAEFSSGHLEGATLVDAKAPDFDQKLAELNRSKTYLLYCRTGHRSGIACEKLMAHHYDAYNLDGGITAWRSAGLNIVSE
jgi:rhodanese-related sulfurtransferase